MMRGKSPHPGHVLEESRRTTLLDLQKDLKKVINSGLKKNHYVAFCPVTKEYRMRQIRSNTWFYSFVNSFRALSNGLIGVSVACLVKKIFAMKCIDLL